MLKYKDFLLSDIFEDYRNISQGTMGFNNPTGLGNIPAGDASYKNSTAVPDQNTGGPMLIGADTQTFKDPYFLAKDRQPRPAKQKDKKRYKDWKFKRIQKKMIK